MEIRYGADRYIVGWPPRTRQRWERLFTLVLFPVGLRISVRRGGHQSMVFVTGVADERPTVTPVFDDEPANPSLLRAMGQQVVFERTIDAAARFTVRKGPDQRWNPDPCRSEVAALESVRRRVMLAYRHDIDHERIADIVWNASDPDHPFADLARGLGVSERHARRDHAIWSGESKLRRPLP